MRNKPSNKPAALEAVVQRSVAGLVLIVDLTRTVMVSQLPCHGGGKHFTKALRHNLVNRSYASTSEHKPGPETRHHTLDQGSDIDAVLQQQLGDAAMVILTLG